MIKNHINKMFYKLFFYRKGKRKPRKSIIRAFKFKELFERYINKLVVLYYDGKHPKHHLWPQHTKFIDENINPNDRVLDIGCGKSMTYNQRIAPIVKYFDAFDINEKKIRYCEKENKFSNVHFSVMDVTKEFPSKKYDVVILSHVLEHLYNPNDVLEKLKSITKKIIVQLPRYDNHWWYLVKKDLDLFYFKDEDHKQEFTIETAKNLIQESGWKVLVAYNDVDIKIIAVLDNN